MKEITAKLEAWAEQEFATAESLTVVQGPYGWDVEVDWDGGYFEEIYSYVYENGQFRLVGVIQCEY